MFGIKKLKKEIDDLKNDIGILKFKLDIPLGDKPSIVFYNPNDGFKYSDKDKVDLKVVVRQILDHLGLEIVKEPKVEEKIVLKKKAKK